MALTRVTKTGNITVDGNVGIETGTVTPRDAGASTLQIGGNGTRSAIKMHTSSSGTGSTDGLFLGYDSGPDFYILNSEANGEVKIGTNNSPGRLVIDASGRVSTPSQPSFFAYLNSTDFTGVGIVPFNNTTYNIGNHFNASNGRFTVPVTGVYMFQVIMTSGTAQTARHQFLAVNGNRYRDMFEGLDFAVNSERHASVNLRLTANDVVDFRNGVTMTVQGGNYNHNSAFIGHLLG